MNAPRMTVLSAQHRRSPGKADAGLKVSSAVEAIVEATAGAVLAGEVDVAGGDVVVGLLIVGFDPGSVRVVAQTKIQGQVSVMRQVSCT